MNYNGNASKSDVEYQLHLQERKRDAHLRMKQTAKLINGELRVSIADEIVGVSKQLQKKK
jgi:hypothetical protein